jgi:hypothetical protein
MVLMPEIDNSQQHWLELAEQLGLPPASAESPPAPPPPIRHPVESPPAVEQEIPQETHAESQEYLEPRALVSPVEEPAEPKATSRAADERRPTRGRRRGRRGGRHTESDAVEAGEPKSLADDAPAVEEGVSDHETPEVGSPEPERSRPRGRGRSRHKKVAAEDAETPAAEEDVEPADVTPEAADDGSDDDSDDMSGWTIPSWQELIDSLYRPDR